jgi:hypothetical protein
VRFFRLGGCAWRWKGREGSDGKTKKWRIAALWLTVGSWNCHLMSMLIDSEWCSIKPRMHRRIIHGERTSHLLTTILATNNLLSAQSASFTPHITAEVESEQNQSPAKADEKDNCSNYWRNVFKKNHTSPTSTSAKWVKGSEENARNFYSYLCWWKSLLEEMSIEALSELSRSDP